MPLDGLEGEPARAFERLAALLKTVQAGSLRVLEPGPAPTPGEPEPGASLRD